MFAQLGAYVLTQLTQSVFLAWCEVLLGHANRAEWQRQQTVDESVGAERKLERPAADIHDDGATDAELEMRERAAEGETSFVVAVQNVDFESGFLANQLHELRAVRGFPDVARRDDFGALDTELLGERRHSSQYNERVLYRDLAQHSPVVQTGAEPRRCFHLVDDADHTRRGNVGDGLPDRVRADVDCRHPNARLGTRRRAAIATSENRVRRHWLKVDSWPLKDN